MFINVGLSGEAVIFRGEKVHPLSQHVDGFAEGLYHVIGGRMELMKQCSLFALPDELLIISIVRLHTRKKLRR